MPNKDNESTMKWKVDITQLKAAMQDAKRSISLANAEFKTATAGMDKWQKSTTGLEAKIKQLNQVLPQQKTILSQLEQEYELVAKNQGENSTEAQRLRLKIEDQKATIVRTEASIDKYNNQLEAMKAEEKAALTPMGQLTAAIKDQESELSSLKTEYSNAVLQYGKNSKEAKDLAKQIDNLSSELNQNKSKMKDASDAADALDKNVDDAGKSADKASDKFSNLGKVMGDAAKYGIAAFATAIAGAVTGLTKATVDAATYADEMNTMATVTGMSTETLQAYNYAAELVDVSMDTLTGSMAKNIKSMSNARKGTGDAAAAYAQLGISVVDANGELRDGESVYWEAIDALGQMEEGANRDALAMAIFGKSAQDLNPLIQQGSAGIAELTEEARNMGAVMSDDQLADLGNFDDSVQRLTSGAAAAKNALGLVLLPQLQTLADEGVSLLGEFTNGIIAADGDWNKISEVIGNSVGDIANVILQEVPNLLQAGTQIVVAIGGAIVDNLPTIATAASEVVVQLVTAFASGLPNLIDAGLQAVVAIITGLTKALPKLIKAIPPMIKGVLNTIIKNLPLILQAGVALLQALVTGITEALPELINYIPVLITSICGFINENLPLLLESGVSILLELVNGILTAIPMLVDTLPTIIETIVTTIMDNLPLILDAGIQILLALINGIVSALPQLIAMLPTIINTFYSTVTSQAPQLVQLGIQLLLKLISGITSAIPDLIRMLPLITKTIIQVITENLPMIFQMGIEVLVSLIEGIVQMIPEVFNAAVEIGAAVIEALVDLVSAMPSIGADIVGGIWEGISNSYTWIKGKIRQWVGNVVSFFKEVLGIGSPSKLMADELGAWMPSGVAVGFERNMPKALASMKASMNDAISDLKADVAVQTKGLVGDVSVNGSELGSGSKQQNITFNQVINSPKAADGMTIYRETNSLLFSAKVRLGNV